MADFEVAIEKLLKAEGGLLRDSDGVTNFGICSKFAPGVDVEHLTRGQAEDWYYCERWLPMNLTMVENQAVAEQIFDAGINCGQVTGVMLAQRAYNDLYPHKPLKVDGRLGPATAMAFNEIKETHQRAFLNAIIYERVRYYLETLKTNPKRESNRVGWLNRI